MKKILFIAFCAFILVGVTGCGEKNPITGEKFSELLQNYEYEVIDMKNMIAEDAAEVAKAARKEETVIQFFILPNVEKAEELYTKYESEFMGKAGDVKPVKKSKANYEYYKIKIDGMYYVTSRIENTYIYISCDESYADEVDTILKDLGY